MFKTFLIAILFFVWLAPRSANGQVGSEPLFLEELIAEAIAKNPEVITARRRAEAARERIPRERAFEDPQVGVTQWSIPSNLNVFDANETWLVVQQKLPFFGKRALRGEVAGKEAEMAAQEIQAAELSIVARVKRAYAGLFYARKALEIYHEEVDLLGKFARIAQEKFAAGRSSQQAVLAAQIELAELSNAVATLEQELEVAEVRLNTLLDRPATAPLGVPQELKPMTRPPSLDELQQTILERQPDLRLKTIAIEQREKVLALSKKNYGPDFMLEGAYLDVHGGPNRWMATVMINFPWINKRRYDAQIAENRAALFASQAEHRNAVNEARFALKDLFVKVDAARREAELLGKSILPMARQNREAALLAYQADKVDFLAAIEAERELRKFNLQHYRALADFESGLAELERIVGGFKGGLR